MIIRPTRIEEGNEREMLKEWTWEHDVEQLDRAAVHGATVMLDQIKEDADLFLTADDGQIEATVNLFGEYFLVFDITENLQELAEEDDISHVRKVWESEIEDKQKFADFFHSLAKSVEATIEKMRVAGTLDEQMGMNYEEWEKIGRPSIK